MSKPDDMKIQDTPRFLKSAEAAGDRSENEDSEGEWEFKLNFLGHLQPSSPTLEGNGLSPCLRLKDAAILTLPGPVIIVLGSLLLPQSR